MKKSLAGAACAAIFSLSSPVDAQPRSLSYVDYSGQTIVVIKANKRLLPAGSTEIFASPYFPQLDEKLLSLPGVSGVSFTEKGIMLRGEFDLFDQMAVTKRAQTVFEYEIRSLPLPKEMYNALYTPFVTSIATRSWTNWDDEVGIAANREFSWPTHEQASELTWKRRIGASRLPALTRFFKKYEMKNCLASTIVNRYEIIAKINESCQGRIADIKNDLELAVSKTFH